MNDRDSTGDVNRARALLREATNVTVLTGAGVSAESGVPTYRGAGGGLWGGLRVEDWATPEGYARDRPRVWTWYSDRRVQLADVRPNAAHRALAELQRRLAARGGRATIVTQNIDALHQAAGAQDVLELHGSLLRIRCEQCMRREYVGCKPLEHGPTCPDCGAAMRPDVVWFGESLPMKVWHAAVDAAAACDVFITAGTSAVVYPAAGLLDVAKGRGARTIEVNLEATPASGAVDVSLLGRAGDVLPELLDGADP